jgi:hypothetical protein
MTVLAGRLDFDDAVSRFRAFLHSQGWPTQIIWMKPGDIILRTSEAVVICHRDVDGESGAIEIFEDASQRALGVSLDAVCTLGDATVAIVDFPSDGREAELLMYPADGGLKMRIAIPRLEGAVRSSD